MGSYWKYYSHHGRPLSVALTEPLSPFDTLQDSYQYTINQNPIRCHNRSRSSGRRYNREVYNIEYVRPPTYYTQPYYGYGMFVEEIPYYPQPYREYGTLVEKIPFYPHPRLYDERGTLVEKIETITIEEQMPPRQPPCVNEVRELKIRKSRRPSSCDNVHPP
ncbi:unnamed protein product, partial [Didymodactylos carnosus]